jgi:broad specificity phosphatase PhoE
MRNKYYLLRHGESLKNVKDLNSSWPEKFYSPLTRRGKREALRAAKSLRKKKIDLIFSSDMLRAKQTAEIVGKELGLHPKFDKRLREIGIGKFNGKPLKDIGIYFSKKEKNISPLKHYMNRFKVSVPGGETYNQVEKRLKSFLKDIDKKYKGKDILIVGHQRPLSLLEKAVSGQSREDFVKKIIEKREIKTGEVRKLRTK